MQSSRNFADKDKINQAIFTGIVVMLVVFAVSLFLPKEWLVSGKVVVFPSGQPASASVNLLAETGNTAEIIKSKSFQKAYFGDFAANLSSGEVNFEKAKALKDSSIVWVSFRSSEADIQAYEDMIVKIPSQVNEYARDLYGGSPFKYKMAGDPEISPSPVRPNLFLNAIIGFLAGVLIYFIYRVWFESKQVVTEDIATGKDETDIISPEIKLAGPDEEEKEKNKIGEGKLEMKDGRPHFVPGKSEDSKSSAPENLPFVDEKASSSDIQEPTDEEVKERLNRLMRGEL